MLKNREEIKNWLDQYEVKNYTINENMTVDVDGHVDFRGKTINNISVQFNTVTGHFVCWNNGLKSLEGSPLHVGEDFSCSYNELTSLEYAPIYVGSGFNCSHNHLTSLKFSPKNIPENFYCHHNQLSTLKGAPLFVGGHFECNNNLLTSLLGAPLTVGDGFTCNNNLLTSLKGCPREIKGLFICSKNRLTTLKFAPTHTGNDFICEVNLLNSLQGAPTHIAGRFICNHNRFLTNFAHGPDFVGSHIEAFYTPIDILQNFKTKFTGTLFLNSIIKDCGDISAFYQERELKLNYLTLQNIFLKNSLDKELVTQADNSKKVKI